MSKLRFSIYVAVLAALPGAASLRPVGAAADTITPTSQDRTVHTAVSNGLALDIDEQSANDFGLFVGSASGALLTASADATQVSQILPAALVATGTASATGGEAWLTFAGSSSTFLVDFALAKDSPYFLAGSLQEQDSFQATATVFVELRDSAGVVIFRVDTGDACVFACDVPLEMGGLLVAGSYTLVAVANADSQIASVTSNYDVDFRIVPEPVTALLLASGLAAMAVSRRQIGPRGTLQHRGTSARVGVVVPRS